MVGEANGRESKNHAENADDHETSIFPLSTESVDSQKTTIFNPSSVGNSTKHKRSTSQPCKSRQRNDLTNHQLLSQCKKLRKSYEAEKRKVRKLEEENTQINNIFGD